MQKREMPLDFNTVPRELLRVIKGLFSLGNLDPLRHSTQLKMKEAWLDSNSDVFLTFASRQLGKTWEGLCEAIETCIKEPGSKVLFYAPTKDKLRDIVNDTITPLSFWAPKGLIKRHKSSDRWTIGKSELRLCILERKHVDRNRGTNAKGLIVIEEACFVSSSDWDYAWGSVIDAQRLQHKPRVLINTTPSVDELHSVHTKLMPMLKAKGAVANFTIYDNPFLTVDEIEEIKTRVTAETWTREYMAKVTRSPTATVIPEFDADLFVKKLTLPPYAHTILSLDQGGIKDPTAMILCYNDYEMRKFCIYRETVLPVNSSISQAIEAAKKLEHDKPQGVVLRLGDAQGQVHLEYATQGFAMLQPQKAPGSFDAMIQALRVGFQNGEILIDPSCEELIRQLISGRFNKQRTDFERDEKGHLDLIAALMYAFQYRNVSNPFPLHFYGHMSSHYMANAPQQGGNISDQLSKLSNRFL